MLEWLNLDGILSSLEVSQYQLESEATGILPKINNTKAISSPQKAVSVTKPLASSITPVPADEDPTEIATEWHDISDTELWQLKKLEHECEKEKEVAENETVEKEKEVAKNRKVDEGSEKAKNREGEKVAEKEIVKVEGEHRKEEEVAEQEKEKEVAEKEK